MDSDLERELWRVRQSMAEAADDIGFTITSALSEVGAAGNRHDDAWRGILALTEASTNLSAAIVEQISRLGAKVEELTNLVANPQTTRADELYRRALTAFSDDWVEESAADAAAAVEADPYHWGAHYLLAEIAVREANHLAAGASFAKAARYAAPRNPHIAAIAALASIHSFRAVPGRTVDAVHVGVRTIAAIKKAHGDTRASPDLLLATAGLTGNPDYATEAFLNNPGLVAVALATGLPGIDEACAHAVDPLVARVQHMGGLFDEVMDRHVLPCLPLIRDVAPLGPGTCPVCDRIVLWRNKDSPVWEGVWAACFGPDGSGPLTERNPLPLDNFLGRASRARSRSRVPVGSTPRQIIGALATTESELFNCAGLTNHWFSLILNADNMAAKARHDWYPHYEHVVHRANPFTILPWFMHFRP